MFIIRSIDVVREVQFVEKEGFGLQMLAGSENQKHRCRVLIKLSDKLSSRSLRYSLKRNTMMVDAGKILFDPLRRMRKVRYY
jgi:hypothetical protein